MKDISLGDLSAGHFTELMGTTFRVQVGSGLVVDLELKFVTGQGTGGRSEAPTERDDPECFALLFEGPDDRPLEQRIYRVGHERLGAFELFIVPVGAAGGARQYESVFNRSGGPRKTSG